jgi:hypothetical protein
MEDEMDYETDDEETIDAEVLTPEKNSSDEDSSTSDLHPADSSVPIRPAISTGRARFLAGHVSMDVSLPL